MRLLDVGTKKLHTFIESKIPPYAILSHTWLKDDEEVTFAQIQQPERCQHMLGYHKIEFLCQQAAKDGFQYAWIDTCCIDKTSSAELSEAINSMFRWYEKAERCYALLSDIDNSEEQSFLTSRWWSRAWTLQELLAPTTVDFFDRNWCLIGKKSDLAESIEKSTGISCKVLRSQPLHHSSVAQRMSWASKRVATRSEDVAYSLFGIFGVNMPLLYGEGERAFLRLQQEVLETSGDHSLFAWNFDSDLIFEQKLMPCSITFPNSGGLFAASPSQFSTCGRIVSHGDIILNRESRRFGSGIELNMYGFWLSNDGEEASVTRFWIGLLPCVNLDTPTAPIGIILAPLMGNHDKFIRISLPQKQRYTFHVRCKDAVQASEERIFVSEFGRFARSALSLSYTSTLTYNVSLCNDLKFEGYDFLYASHTFNPKTATSRTWHWHDSESTLHYGADAPVTVLPPRAAIVFHNQSNGRLLCVFLECEDFVPDGDKKFKIGLVPLRANTLDEDALEKAISAMYKGSSISASYMTVCGEYALSAVTNRVFHHVFYHFTLYKH